MYLVKKKFVKSSDKNLIDLKKLERVMSAFYRTQEKYMLTDHEFSFVLKETLKIVNCSINYKLRKETEKAFNDLEKSCNKDFQNMVR